MGKFKNKPLETQASNLREETFKNILLEADALVSENLLQTPGGKIFVSGNER